MTSPVIECSECAVQFTDAQVAEIKDSTCPSCGTKEPPKLIGGALLAKTLVDEYLAIKPQVLSGALHIQDLSARQLAGNWLLSFGRRDAVVKFRSLSRPERRRMEKTWPGLTALLEEIHTKTGTESWLRKGWP